jgi:uncharacterized protein YcbK (DUF882 family)
MAAWFAGVAVLSFGSVARAQDGPGHHVYVVGARDTLSRVASRLHVPAAEIIVRNRLQPPYSLRIGRRLLLPPGVPAEVYRSLPARDRPAAANSASTPHHEHTEIDVPVDEPLRPGWVTFVRRRDDAEATINLRAPIASYHARLERFFRFRDGSRHVVHPRLAHDLATLSDHFGSRHIVLLSGFRPQLAHSTGPRTRHSQGYAVDIRVEGIALHALFAYCQTLENVGCGLYPRANFVHIDVRRESDSWTDESPPGSRRASSTVQGSDETVSEVLADAATNAH